jgi:transposase-like protein
MAGITWVIVGILKIYPINPLIGVVVIVSGICQYVYGYLKEKEKKKLLPIKEKPQKSKITFADQLKSSLNSLKDHNKP